MKTCSDRMIRKAYYSGWCAIAAIGASVASLVLVWNGASAWLSLWCVFSAWMLNSVSVSLFTEAREFSLEKSVFRVETGPGDLVDTVCVDTARDLSFERMDDHAWCVIFDTGEKHVIMSIGAFDSYNESEKVCDDPRGAQVDLVFDVEEK